ncbi:MAG: AI-2E family transporter [Cellulophaga sp.]
MNTIKTTNKLLLIIVIPLVFYLLKLLSFIFIPLVFSMFIALLFLPIMRWLTKRKVPRPISIILVVLLILIGLKLGGELVKLSSREIVSTNAVFIEKAEVKLKMLVFAVEEFLGAPISEDGKIVNPSFLKENIGTTVQFIGNTLTMLLMTVFFVVLWLAESMNVQKLLHNTILKQKHTSIKTFIKIEKDLIKFIKVKFLVSFFTGIGTALACIYFDISFPIFWGLFAFAINFVQMIGSFISVIFLSLFAIVELDPSSTLLFFILVITGVQILFGAILEPIFMGKSFSINIIAVLIMLMFWGYIWGVPGLIMAIPITVFMKIILSQFPQTKIVADLISGTASQNKITITKK